MIVLYSGTPGSGKSLDCAKQIRKQIEKNKPIITNMLTIKNENIIYKKTTEINTYYLYSYSKQYFKDKDNVEDEILLIIDEAQILFNPRKWNESNRLSWIEFFCLHRHYGYKVILVTQRKKSIDRQIADLIEYEVKHKKVKNFGLLGYLINLVYPFGEVFRRVTINAPFKTVENTEFMIGTKKDFAIYNTYEVINS